VGRTLASGHWKDQRVNSSLQEIESQKRFGFGKNWGRFLRVLNNERIEEAERSLREMLEIDDLTGKSFLDVGSGSGLFSLAARRLGARVHSFDFDPQSVACTAELKRRYFPDDPEWRVDRASALDENYLKTIGTFDVVYSWGVLHHTGAMWQALENVEIAVEPRGRLYLAIYNDQRHWSVVWKQIKKLYNTLPVLLRIPYAACMIAAMQLKTAARSLLMLQPQRYIRSWTQYHKTRGMSHWYDMIDWIGGYPFEVAAPEEIFDFYRSKGFLLLKLKTCAGGKGCNEFVFQRAGAPSERS